MNVQSIALASAGAQAFAAGGSGYELRDTVAVEAGRVVFRRLFGLRVSTGGIANGIRFDVDSANFAATFAPLELDMRDHPKTNVAQQDAQTLTVTLPVPMQISRIAFGGGKVKHKKGAAPLTGTVELYRMDGDKPAKDFTTSSDDNTAITDDFTDLRFAIKLNGKSGYQNITPSSLHDISATGFPTSARLGLAAIPDTGQPLAPSFFCVIAGEVGKTEGVSGSPPDAATKFATALQQYFDALVPPYADHIDLLLVAESDAPCKLSASTFAIPFGLVRSSFRAVLLRPEDFTDARAFALRLLEASTPLTAYLRGQLSTQTRDALARSSDAAVPAPVLAAIVQQLNDALQRDAFYTPARFAGIDLKPATVAAANAAPTGVARTRLNRTLLEEAFPGELSAIPGAGADEKQVLRAGDAQSTLEVSADMPRSMTIRNAVLRLEGDLRDGAAPAAASSDFAPAWDAPIPETSGFTVDATRAAATLFTPSVATTVTGIAVAVSGNTVRAELTAELRADQSGMPAGRTLGSATAKLDQLDRVQWLRFSFDKEVVLTQAACWLMLRATDGSVVWLAESSGATTRIGDPAPKGWTDRGEFTDRKPLLQVLSNSPADGAEQIAADGLRVRIGNVVLTPLAVNGGKSRTVDVKSALQAFLASASASDPLAIAPIEVAAMGRGNITIYPPEIEYDL